MPQYEQVFVKSVKELLDALENIKSKSSDKVRIFGIFSGSLEDSTGESWCIDCRKAEPVIEQVIEQLGPNNVIIYCDVGPREIWKDKENPFRKCDKTRVTSVPTLLEFGINKRLEDKECADAELVRAFFLE